MKLNLIYIIFPFLFLPTITIGQGNGNYISLHLKNQNYQNNQLITLESDYYFNIEKGDLVVHGNLPENHIKISNRLGEIKIYYPEKNEISISQGQYFSSENELIYYFLSNNYYDLGLSGEGFKITDTRLEGNFQIVTWRAPVGMQIITKIELVFENEKPIYAAYFNMNNNIIRKIYYYNYEIFRNFIMPMKVTQISYIEEGDSVVQRNTYSNLKTSEFPSSSFFNFKIPQDATVIK